MAKTLCERKQTLKKDRRKYMRLVRQPTHLCLKCGRVANRKKWLCDPVSIPKD